MARILGDGRGSARAALPSCSRTTCSSTALAGRKGRQGQGRGPGRLCPAQLPGAPPRGRELRGAERLPRAALPGAGWLTGCGVTTESIGERLERDLDALQPLPSAPYDACEIAGRRACPRCHWCAIDRNDYSVPTAYGHREVLVRGYVEEVVIACGAEIIARHAALVRARGLRVRPAALPGAARAQDRRAGPGRAAAGWDLPEAFATLRRLLEARMGKRGKREFVQVLRLMEAFRIEDVACGCARGDPAGAIGFDAVKHLVLCRIERRPPRLDMTIYPYLPRVAVATTSARAYLDAARRGRP